MAQTALILGSGSAGQRHKALLEEAGIEAFFHDRVWGVLPETVDMAFVCTPTVRHISDAIWCVEHGWPVFMEKPIGCSLHRLDELIGLSQVRRVPVYVGYVLNLHPAIQRLGELSLEEEILWAKISCCTRLSAWPGRGKRESYSKYEALGGGALLDLSHELYYAEYALGPVESVTGVRVGVSAETVDTDDLCEITLRHSDGLFSQIHLDLCSATESRGWEVCLASGEIITVAIDTSDRAMAPVWRDQRDYFLANLAFPRMTGDLIACAPLYRKIIKFREEGLS